MARRKIDFRIEAEGRDHGKVFVIEEFSARRTEWLALQIFQALVRSGALKPDDEVQQMGMQGVAALGFEALGKIDPIHVKPLLDEMMQAVVGIRPDPLNNPSFTRPLIEDDIEEVSTLFTLRMEIYYLHTGFTRPVGNSTGLTSEIAAGSSTIQTSPRPSGRLSRQAVRR